MKLRNILEAVLGRANRPGEPQREREDGSAGTPRPTIWGVAILTLLLAVSSASAASFPVGPEGFETYADGTTLNSLSNQGWGASSDAVTIKTITNVADAVRGTNAMFIPAGLIASNAVSSLASSNVWVDVYAHASMGMSADGPGSANVDTNMTVELFLDTNGCPVVWNPSSNAWLVCTQDFQNASVLSFTSQWERVTLCQNYSNKTVSLFLNEHLLFTGLRFINTNQTFYNRFQADGGLTVTSYLDQVSMNYTPPANWTTDLDNDGMSEAQEIQLYGNTTTRYRPLITVAVPPEGTVATNGFGSGVVTNGGSFDIKPGATNTFWLAASNGYYVADAKTNGTSVVNFSGQFTSNALCTWTNIMPDGLANGTFEAVFALNPQLTVTAPANGTVSPMNPSAYPFTAVDFTLIASNGYYVANVLTNSVDVGDFTGRYTSSGSYQWPSVATNGGGLTVQFQRNPQLTAAALATGVGPSPTGGTVTLSTNEVYPNGQVNCALTADVAYAVSELRTNGITAATFGGQPRTASCTISNIWADMIVTGVFTYTATRYVPGDYSILQAAVAAALPGETLVVGANVYTNNVTLDKSLTLIAANATLDGALTVLAGTTGMLSGCQGLVVTGGVTVANGGLLLVNGGSNNVGTLTIQSGGTVQVVNATAFIANGTTYNGTFTFVYGWDISLVKQALPFFDSFESYPIGAQMNNQGNFGWSASSAGVVVQTNQVQSGQAVGMPAQSVFSGTMATTALSNIWVEFYYQDTNRVPFETATTNQVDTNVAVEAFITTNGYVAVFNPELGVGQWDLCTNDAQGASISTLSNDAWVRITINQNYTRRKAAVFLNGRLLRQELRFINTNLVNSGKFEVDAGYGGPTYVDTYSVRTNWVGIVDVDVDQDSIPDAQEIDLYGNTRMVPAGSVFKIR